MPEVLLALGGVALLVIALEWLIAARRARAARLDPLVATEALTSPQPFVSVVVPAWNERGTIERCIAALQEVRYPDWETVIVAGGPDGTYDAAIRASGSLPRSTVLGQRPLGKPAAINAGVDAAHGSIIVILDADSVVGPEWLSALVRPIGGHALATTGRVTPARWTYVSRVEHIERIAAYDAGHSDTLQGAASIAVDRSVLDRLGGIPEDSVADDWELDAALSERGIPKAYCPDAVVESERPATISEYWRNELRWRRAHLASLIRFRQHLLGGLVSGARALYPYLVAWFVFVVLVLAATAYLLGATGAGTNLAALALLTLGLVLLRHERLLVEVIAYTGDMRWLRDTLAVAVLFAVSLVAGFLATLTPRRSTLQFKGPRPHAREA